MPSCRPTCVKCGQQIVGTKHMYGGKAYCEACYNALIAELTKLENQKAELYKYICDLFGKSECPEFVTSSIEKLLAAGRKVGGIKATLWWYYEIEGHPTDNINYIGKIISDQYENAHKYVVEQKKIQAHNAQVDLHNIPSQTVKINSDRNKRRWKPNYRMEDL